MKKLILVLFLGFILSGCSTTWYINKAKDRCPECFKQDTTISNITVKRDTTIYIDSTFLLVLPEDTFMLDIPLEELNGTIFETIKSDEGIINTEVSVSNGILHIETHLDSTMIYRFQDSIRIRDAFISHQREVIIDKGIIIEDQSKELKWYEKVWRIGKFVLIGLCILIIVAIIIKIIKWIKK